MQNRIFKAAAYLRLSREDYRSGSVKDESNSIINQRKLIEQYVKEHPDIELSMEFADDGISGVSFERPAFREMMAAVSKGEVHCILVKDLSRFGRNYIDAGNYIERVFPYLGIRFIAVLDRYDSFHTGRNDRIIVPFKNLINDSYAREGSVNVRNTLAVKRKRGEYVNAFTKFGYRKKEGDPHKVEIDPCAAAVVRKITACLLEGMCPQRVADYLNGSGVLSPYEYKKSAGCRYKTSFQTKRTAAFCAQTVIRIARDPVYNGWLIMGKTTTPNHKVKKRIAVPEDRQIKIPKGLPEIISDSDFALVQRALDMDTRLAPGETEIYRFSGVARCAYCGQPLIRRKVMRRGKEYRYLICSERKKNAQECRGVTIREELIEQAVTQALRVGTIFMENPGAVLKELSQKEETGGFWKEYPEKLCAERETLRKLCASLYQDFREGMFGKEEYLELKEEFEERIRRTDAELIRMEEERREDEDEGKRKAEWIKAFLTQDCGPRLTRAGILHFVERIEVYDRDETRVVFRFGQGRGLWQERADA